MVKFLDVIRENLGTPKVRGRNRELGLAGLVARILSFPRYRGTGYFQDLFRQAMLACPCSRPSQHPLG